MLRIHWVQRDPKTWVLVVEGAVDHSTVPQLQEEFDALLEKGLRRLVVDLERVAFIASAGFGCLLNIREAVRERGGDLVFAGTSTRVREIFDLLGITTLLHFAPDVGSALVQIELASPQGPAGA
jgi:anti-sigma B factor antagonist